VERRATTSSRSAVALSAPRLSRAVTRQLSLAGVLLALAAIAWVATARLMRGMDGGPGTDPGALDFYLGTWIVMMAAMMLPALTPAALSYADLGHEPRRRFAHARSSALFVAGYLAVWALAGLAGYAVLEAGRSLDGGVLAWHRAGRWVAAAVLLAAALYQLTPAKRLCLTRCRDARALRLARRADRGAGGLVSGIRHGMWCVGCCWVLMAGLFALGAMSLVWMAAIAALVAAERLLPWRKLGIAAVASVLVALALGMALAPSSVPELTIPGSPAAMRSMAPMAHPMAHPMAAPMAHPMAPGMAAGRR
jgi:predicted metal-binding membrane protein